MIALTREYITGQEYLEFDREALYYHEYFDGRITVMSDRMPWQSILANVTESLVLQLRNVCSIYTSEQCVGKKPIPKPVDSVEMLPRANRGIVIESLPTLANPAVIVEIMPPGTKGQLVDSKFDLCRMNEALNEYITVSHDVSHVDHLTKDSNAQWIRRTYRDMGDKLRIESIPCVLKLSNIYQDIEFPSRPGPTNLSEDENGL